MRRILKILAVLLFVGGLQFACGDVTGPESMVTIRFQAASGPTVEGQGAVALARNASLGIAGTNGVLVIDELWLVVSEFELKRSNVPDGDDDDDNEGEDDSEEFELPPAFVQVPLIDGEIPVVRQAVPAGQYSEIQFDVEDLLDDLDDDDFVELATLLLEIRQDFPEWPDEASMFATGTFTPTGGTPVSFDVFFEAEIEIEMELRPPLIVEADDSGAFVDVTVDPRLWFLRGDGTVLDLSQFDFASTGELVEFEFEMEDGFTEVEFDD